MVCRDTKSTMDISTTDTTTDAASNIAGSHVRNSWWDNILHRFPRFSSQRLPMPRYSCPPTPIVDDDVDDDDDDVDVIKELL